MKICLKVREVSTGEFSEDFHRMMHKSGLDVRMRYEDIGLQSDGTAVIFDRCGNFAYLSDEFEIVIMIDSEVM